jgi:2-oxoglutarate dehydrogenase E2 component (dihydrolipoamide succinyltransferase)
MSDSVQMPALGESVSEGTVTRWLKQVGDRVEVDEPLLEVSTDKVDTEIPSPFAGVLEKILVSEDETVAVGTELAVIGNGTPGGGAPAEASPVAAPEPAAAPAAPGEPAGAAPPAEPVAPAGSAPAVAPSTDAEQPAAAPQAAVAPGKEGTRIQMPALGESVSQGTVTRWLKKEGDDVGVDEPLLEVSTDKVDTEIPSPVAGIIQKILVSEDETVDVGADLAIIGGAGAATAPAQPSAPATAPASSAPRPAAEALVVPPSPAAPPAPRPAPAQASRSAQASPPVLAPVAPSGRSASPADLSVYVTPLVRRLAADNAINLSAVTGTGVGGRIRKQDVLDAAAAKAAAEAEAARRAAPASRATATGAPAPVSALRGTTVPMSRLRKVIAKRMVESLQVSAQLTTVVEADITRIAKLRTRAKTEFEAREGVKLSFLPFLALAAVEALKQYPVVNASLEGDNIIYHAEENLGIAVDTDRGLLVPVIHGAGNLNIAGLARKIADLAERTRTNKVTPDEIGGGTFTLTNTGSRGALFDTPIINQPQVAILGTGAVVKRPVVISDPDGGESIAVRSMIYLALSYDHRIVDGADAARFLTTMKQRLEEGQFEGALGL